MPKAEVAHFEVDEGKDFASTYAIFFTVISGPRVSL
jgi:hypothetical protein